MPIMDDLLAVVLCGGESKRMGRDKGLLLKGTIPWAQYIAAKLNPFQVPVVFSINSGQREAYSAVVPAEQLIPDSLSVPGPLKGLLSVHARFPSKDLFLLACDMLDLDGPTLSKMIAIYDEDSQPTFWQSDDGKKNDHDDPRKKHDFFVYRQEQFIQPFCGIYTSRGLAPAYELALKNELPDFSLQSLLKKGKTKRMEIGREEAFRNYNSL
jgi:molybdenum cofactor guanylyltransferase